MANYIKNILLIICSFLCSQNIIAQTDTLKANQLKKRLTDSICLCISRTDTNSVNNIQDAQALLTKCITDNMNLYMEYVVASGNDIEKMNEEKVQEIATKISLEVYNHCPSMKIMINHVNEKQH